MEEKKRFLECKMKRISLEFCAYINQAITCIGLILILSIARWSFNEIPIQPVTPMIEYRLLINTTKLPPPSCSCRSSLINETYPSFCSNYSTSRGLHQRIISISMYISKDQSRFSINTSIDYLYQLIDDMKSKYPEWILRIYHDETIPKDLVCSIECTYSFVDFCNTSALGNLGRLSGYIPAKIWRFLPIGDPLVDIIASRDLDSPLTQREVDAVTDWLSSGKAWHVMRDHPFHVAPMLGKKIFFQPIDHQRSFSPGGTWAFRSALNRLFGQTIQKKILDRSLIGRYHGVDDQTFLKDYIWPRIQNDLLAHDSFLCETSYGRNSRPWPTRRPLISNDRNCFVGCVRPCCRLLKYPFEHCPLSCRPRNHSDWNFC